MFGHSQLCNQGGYGNWAITSLIIWTCLKYPSLRNACRAFLKSDSQFSASVMACCMNCCQKLLSETTSLCVEDHPMHVQVFLSHLHSDHITDLPPLYALANRQRPLEVWGPSGAIPATGTNATIEGLKAVSVLDPTLPTALLPSPASRLSSLNLNL